MEVKKKNFLKWLGILTLMSLFLLPLSTWSVDFYGITMGSMCSTGGVTVGDQEQNTSGEALTVVASDSTTKYIGTKFLTTDTYNVCRLVVPIQKNNTNAQNTLIRFAIYTNSCTVCDRSDDSPGTQLALSESSWRVSLSLSPRNDRFDFPGIKPLIVSDNFYWVVAYSIDSTAANYWQWQSTDSGVTEDVKKSSDGTTWESESATISLRWILYK
jgi:hypothetical protein